MSPMPAIEVRDLQKVFRVPDHRPGMAQALRHLVRPRTREVVAVAGLTFTIQAGERVAFVGPNGAGKSTTIKVLSGILHPDAGEARVSGLVPWTQRRALGFRIGTVFGQRTQLWYHLPAGDTFDLLAHVYEQERERYRRRRAELVEVFGLGDLLAKPVRQLSLGQRMRCEIVASLLHAPEVLFLDEPTIGLDVDAKAVIRDLIQDRSRNDGCTVLLTSHDTGDMERVCDRVIVIHEGRLLLDQPVRDLRQGYIRRKVITLHTAESRIDLAIEGVQIVTREPHRTVLEVDTDVTPIQKVVERALAGVRLRDMTVEDPPMEEIVQAIYARAPASRRPGAP